MTYRIGWVSPLTSASGVGTFSHAVAEAFPTSTGGETIDLTMLHLDHHSLYRSSHRAIRIENSESFHEVLTLFDLLVYNVGNNRQHHGVIFDLLAIHPGIVVCHDYVYQHVLADRSLRAGRGFASYAALLLKYGGEEADGYLARSRITSRNGRVRYSPWDSEASVSQPMSEAILDLGSALVVHSAFARAHAEKHFEGPILQLGMPHDQKPLPPDTLASWQSMVALKRSFHAVSFGHIQRTKCIDLVLQAIAASKMLRVKLRFTVAGMVGDEDYLARLREMVAASSLGDNVVFEIGVSETRLADLMADADLFINLRRPNTEGSSASLTEQLDAGRPVIVLDSGCYGEIPNGAAVKLPQDAGPDDIRRALESLIDKPEKMPAIGRAGRAHARAWRCASYGEKLVRFAMDHRELLGRRARVSGISATVGEACDVDDHRWLQNLARARAAFHYLDRNMLSLDPELVMGKSHDDLCVYVAHVILGVFDDVRLYRALSRFFVGRDARTLYWACARFALIVEAVFAENEDARARLKIMGPCWDTEFWDVIEAFPSDRYFAVATLMLSQRMPGEGEFTSIADDGERGVFLKRLALLDFLQHVAPDAEGGRERLKRWLEDPYGQSLDCDLPAIDGDLDCVVGSRLFRENADLSNFHPMEPDHAWARGNRGFLGLRLGTDVISVELRVRHIDASNDRPATIGLSSGTASVEIDVRSLDPYTIKLEITPNLAQPDATTWLQISTSRAASGQQDPRMLGACLLNLRIATGTRLDANAAAKPATQAEA